MSAAKKLVENTELEPTVPQSVIEKRLFQSDRRASTRPPTAGSSEDRRSRLRATMKLRLIGAVWALVFLGAIIALVYL